MFCGTQSGSIVELEADAGRKFLHVQRSVGVSELLKRPLRFGTEHPVDGARIETGVSEPALNGLDLLLAGSLAVGGTDSVRLNSDICNRAGWRPLSGLKVDVQRLRQVLQERTARLQTEQRRSHFKTAHAINWTRVKAGIFQAHLKQPNLLPAWNLGWSGVGYCRLHDRRWLPQAGV